jgi:cytosine/adenosine deaminase-related metal-dependent hydrolase
MPADAISSYGLRGRVVTMDASRTVLGDGIVWVAGGSISDVTAASDRPPAHAASPVISTAGTIYPGMIELHNHLAYDTLPLFPIPRPYTKREEWQGTVGYRRYVSGPAGVIASVPELIRATVRYVECKSLISGTTTSQGLTLRTEQIKHLYQGIVRDAELPDAPGLVPARPKIGDVTPDSLDSFRKSLAGKGARILHLAEGLPTSAARQHFLDLQAPDGTWAITPEFVGIHATGLNAGDLAVVAQHGGSIVWSPFSNLILYRATADIATAMDLGIKVALGSDWSPTASKNLLNELKVAQIYSRASNIGLTDQQLVEMVTISPAQILGWQGLLGSIEPAKLADLTVVAGRTGEPYGHLVDATESGIRLVVIAGTGRYGTPALLGKLSPVDEQFEVAGQARAFHLDTKDPDPVLGAVALGDAARTLADALEHMPERAAAIGSADLGVVAHESVAGASADDRWFLELDQPPIAGVGPALSEGVAPALLDLVTGAESFASIAVPLKLDPLATQGDDAFFAMLANLANVPEAIRAELPRRYGEEPRSPTADTGLADDDRPIAPLPLQELLDRPGDLTLRDRRLIVGQAIVLLEQAYVHLPIKRARYAIDPLQRLRLLEHSLQDHPNGDRGPESRFHSELIEIFTSLRDLHTHYVPPEPYRSHTVYLPFLVEECTRDGRQQYIVSKVAAGADLDPSFAAGVEVTHWSGTPIERAIERNADRQGGGNHAARMARGTDALTIRTLGRTAPPDEDWVDVTYRTGDGGEREVRVRWHTYQPFEPSPFGDAQQAFAAAAPASTGDLGRLAALGIDAQTTTVNLVRRDLFARGRQARRAAAGADELATELPGVLRARVCHTSIGDVIHVRIFTFLVPDPTAFVDEFLRLCQARPSAGLIVDVRGNGGGDIRAAEQLLQVLTPRRIEPEPAQFIVSPLIRQLCSANQGGEVDLTPWAKSVQDAVETGASFSTGFPIGSADEANSRGQGYYGPVVLVTDARCYSATDIFAAGFQDHGIGPVLGLAEFTGAGGANVWTHGLLRQLLPARNTPLKPLPRQAAFRVAIRRTTRVGAHAGELLEDLGVASGEVHHVTLDDLLEDNKDLIEAAAGLMRGHVPRSLEAEIEPTAEGVTIGVRSAHLDRVDAYIDQRPVGSQDVDHDRCVFRVPLTVIGPSPRLRLEGFERGCLAAVKVITVPGSPGATPSPPAAEGQTSPG